MSHFLYIHHEQSGSERGGEFPFSTKRKRSSGRDPDLVLLGEKNKTWFVIQEGN